MKLILGLMLSVVFLVGVSDSFAQISHSVNVSFEDNIAESLKFQFQMNLSYYLKAILGSKMRQVDSI